MPDIASVPSFDIPYFRSALGRFATGVTIITTESSNSDPQPLGLTVSSFNSVSLEPPLILWSLAKKASSLPHYREAERYVIHVLGAKQLEMAKRFAWGPQSHRFEGKTLSRAPNGTLMIDDHQFAAWFECTNITQHEAGDHFIFVGKVEHCFRNFEQPLIYHAGDFELTPVNQPWDAAKA
ncbi:flavin reductase family protein [Paenalcaligenes niemegkensis]|uniref:flavin reductase family protein n=1 Tax=Paenalcaligenes niemegkensis TaxID=2895469 RepID=UPI001EE7D300|nr:flavin reductase family protein [Paenalcaligenes niemegkensis]MCQ9617132.1 flavin reductase family protein [Paenalcaligenes niemegkensis]